AVIAMTKAIAKDVAGSGVIVNCVTPAVIDTPILEGLTDEHINYMVDRIPLRRMGTSDEVANLICWLASEDCSFSTGATFDISGRRTVGAGETIGVRSDSAWSVPEPEIALVLGEDGRIDGVTIGNDVSSRDIEGTNPLYLPQAKIYAGSCALGPAVLTEWEGPFEIRLRILEDGRELFAGETSTAQMQRSFEDLVDWLSRENPVPPGSVLLTGTGLVPPDEFNLQPGHVVEIEVPGIGTLRNPVGAAADL